MVARCRYPRAAGRSGVTVPGAVLNFLSKRSAEAFVAGNRWSVGINQGPAPRGIICESGIQIAKWRNLDRVRRYQLDGVLVPWGRGAAAPRTMYLGYDHVRRAARSEPMAEVGGIAGEQLRAYIERIERLEEEKAALAGDLREVYAEAKGNGFDVKIMRQIIRLRKMDREDRQEQEELLQLYQHAIGMN